MTTTTENGVRHPTIPHAAPPDELPAIDVYRLTGADLRAFLGMHSDPETRQQMGLDLLEKAVDGGLAAIPLPYIGQYVEQLNALLSEATNPKNSAGASGAISGPRGRSRRSS